MILDLLPEVLEHVRFGAVCKYWYAISNQYHKQRHGPYHRRALPMLLIRSPNASAEHDPPQLYALSCLGEYYPNLNHHPLPFTRFRYCGSSNGWLATQNQDFTVTLLYPFAAGGQLVTVHLPALDTLVIKHPDFLITKLIVSPESTPDDYTVIAIYGDMKKMATIKSGEDSWFCLMAPRLAFRDVIFHRKRIYAIDNFLVVVKLDVESRPPRFKTLYSPGQLFRYWGTYIVESSSSEIYLLGRAYDVNSDDEDELGNQEEEEADDENEEEYDDDSVDTDDDHNQEDEEVTDDEDEEGENLYYNECHTIKFDVYKLKLRNRTSGNMLEKQNDLGGDAFFVGECESTSFPATRFPGCKPNSIYFTDDLIDCWRYQHGIPEDIGCYNVEDGSIDRFYDINACDRSKMLQPIWILPKRHHHTNTHYHYKSHVE
uniref:KIB1-4 beta-propeller domain-containing protein n=1 Tax=Kalanchoe fedtschenkoi TaxID=63787 RepID=A0A7N0T7H6_KALFE